MMHEPSMLIYIFLLSHAVGPQNPSIFYFGVRNDYEGVKQVAVRALKNGSPFVQQMIDLYGIGQFGIHSIVYLAWLDLKQGDLFKFGTYEATFQIIDLTNPTTKLAAKTVKVTVTIKGNDEIR